MSDILYTTERLILRRFSSGDLDDLYEYLSDAETVKYEPYEVMSYEETKKELENRIASEEMTAVELKETHKLIGNIYTGKREFDSTELGYVFNRRFWKKGYARESCTAVMNGLFEKGIHRIYAECDPDNPNSWRLLERLGLTREAFLRENIYFEKDADGKPIWKDTYIYAKLNK